MNPGLAQELAELIDRQAITALVHGYCRAVDRRDVEAARVLYHPDAIDDHGSYYVGSATGYLDKLPELMAPVRMMQHHITTLNIRLDGDYAESEAYGLAIHQMDGAEGPSDLIVGTRFLDKFERRDGTWKIAHRTHALDWVIANPTTRFVTDHPDFAGSPRGQAGADDPSFAFFRLFEHRATVEG